MKQLTIDEVIDHCERSVNRELGRMERRNDKGKYSLLYLEHLQTSEWLKELKEYKRLEEQGLLLKLPYKIGQKIYVIAKKYMPRKDCTQYVIKALRIKEYTYDSLNKLTTICEERDKDIICRRRLYESKRIFLNKEEAEKELERLNNEKN
ncbi:MAG: hypothetical protein E7262_02560 [Lachnospiraceae bacterium]|nr:hypothetical protein [Lachnospiraceae bacterium]